MRIAVMQPYFAPYIGYFQLAAAVDKFVLLDDVNYINRGWINRNRIWSNGQPEWLTIPLVKASQNKLINELEILPDDGWKSKLLGKVERAYINAPQFGDSFVVVKSVIDGADGQLAAFLHRALLRFNNQIGIQATIEPTSTIYPKTGLRGQERILAICRHEHADTYVNLPGGKALYEKEAFEQAGVQLRFIDANLQNLPVQFNGAEGPILSIIDLLMLNPTSAIRAAAGMCRLIA